MVRNSAPALLLLAVTAVAPFLPGQTARPEPKRERFQNAEVLYGWAPDIHGHRLRTFITRPNNAISKVPAIFFVGWLSCDSVEYPDADTKDGFGILLRRLIEQSGYATVRVDKPGVGESEGKQSADDHGRRETQKKFAAGPGKQPGVGTMRFGCRGRSRKDPCRHRPGEPANGCRLRTSGLSERRPPAGAISQLGPRS